MGGFEVLPFVFFFIFLFIIMAKETVYEFTINSYDKPIVNAYFVDGKDKQTQLPTGERLLMIEHVEKVWDDSKKRMWTTTKYKTMLLTKIQELYNMPWMSEADILSIVGKGKIVSSTIFSPL